MNETQEMEFIGHLTGKTYCDRNTTSMPCFESLYQLTELWVFGYGSILWNTGFEYNDKVVGYVNGFTRKFWQGNTTHRGTPECPGRVATLVHKRKGKVWGIAFHVKGQCLVKKALEHLGLRECSLGGYTCRFTHFNPRASGDKGREVLTFLAVPDNSLFLGPAPLAQLAEQVASCHGRSGSNAEYVIRLAQYVRQYIPEDTDQHLFELETEVLHRLNETMMDWQPLPNMPAEPVSNSNYEEVKEESQLNSNTNDSVMNDSNDNKKLLINITVIDDKHSEINQNNSISIHNSHSLVNSASQSNKCRCVRKCSYDSTSNRNSVRDDTKPDSHFTADTQMLGEFLGKISSERSRDDSVLINSSKLSNLSSQLCQFCISQKSKGCQKKNTSGLRQMSSG